MTTALDSRIAAAKRAVLAQVDLLHREFGRARSEWKADGTRVTAVDLAISAGITEELLGQFPADEVLSEELQHPGAPIALRAEYAWVLDPIDGTNNYATGIANCAISLGLLRDGMPVYGVIYDLGRRTLMHGGPGYGAFDGDRPASVLTAPPDAQTLLGFHSPHDHHYAVDAATIVENFKIRGLGSSTLHLAYVAVGILSGTLDHNVKVWDIAAAVPLCLGGGGDVQYLRSSPFPLRTFDIRMDRILYVAGNPEVCARVRKLLGR